MAWELDVADDGFIELRIRDVLAPDELQEAFSATLAAARDADHYLVLADCTDMAGGHTVIDLVQLAEELSKQGVLARFREAVVLPLHPDIARLVQFWEVASLNRGLLVRTFPDRESAAAWLRQVDTWQE